MVVSGQKQLMPITVT